MNRGFTLIELSIVLVIIGLIIGSVLVGQDLIKAAEVRATISQIEKYNTAVNTFYGKYGALPGDMNNTTALRFGFAARSGGIGGDGNGIIEGFPGGGMIEEGGEPLMFWVDLTTANGLNLNMIDGSFSTATPNGIFTYTGSQLNKLFPQAKLGRGNYIYVGSGGFYCTNGYVTCISSNNLNYFTLAAMTTNNIDGAGYPQNNWNIPAAEAYSIDKKMDDGYPMTGRVLASLYFNTGGYGTYQVPEGSTDSATTCFNTATSTGAYSLSINSGAGPNCGLLFQFQ